MTKYKIKCKCAIVDVSPKEKKKQCMATSLLNFSKTLEQISVTYTNVRKMEEVEDKT